MNDTLTRTVRISSRNDRYGLEPKPLLNASASSNGSLIVFSIDSSSGVVKPTAVIALGDRVDHMRSDGDDAFAVVGSFGVASLLFASDGEVSVQWSDSLAQAEPGSCGLCCNIGGNVNVTCRVAIATDGECAFPLSLFYMFFHDILLND